MIHVFMDSKADAILGFDEKSVGIGVLCLNAILLY